IILNFIMSVTLSYKTRAVNNIKSQRPIVAGVSLDGNLASLADAEKKIGAKLDSLQGLVGKDRVFLTKKLNKLGKIMPESAWIEAFKFSDETGKSRTLNITGMIYSKDRDEAAIANRILSQMKQDPGLSEGFQDIKLSSLKRVSAYGKELAEFSIDCTGSISRFAESAVAYMNAGEF
ncbi:MAG: PilN domain-containing protein, partial [Candidatus Omnitrophica bacterium]|nr:PilN domain-containing protein [Candidatus Omnitrophota bacterium]